jgi:hypothetical protein
MDASARILLLVNLSKPMLPPFLDREIDHATSSRLGVDHNMGRKPWAKALRLISRNALAYGLARFMIDAVICPQCQNEFQMTDVMYSRILNRVRSELAVETTCDPAGRSVV